MNAAEDESEAGTAWTRFRSEIAICDGALISSLNEISHRLVESAHSWRRRLLQMSPAAVRPASLASLRETLHAEADILLVEPAAAFRAWNPHQQIMRAFGDHDARLEAVAAAAPEFVVASWREWREATATEGTSASLSRFNRLAFGWSRRTIPFRQILLDRIYSRRHKRISMQGEMLMLLGAVGLDTTACWRIVAETRFSELSRQPARRVLASEIAAIQARLDARAEAMATAVAGFESWLNRSRPEISGGFAAQAPSQNTSAEELQADYVKSCAFWARQRRAVESTLDLEVGLLRAEIALVGAAEKCVQAVDDEHRHAVATLEEAVNCLSRTDGPAIPFSPPAVDVLSAAHRTRMWREGATRYLRFAPEAVEVAKRLTPRERHPGSWRTLQPRRVLEHWLNRIVPRTMAPASLDAERQTQTIARQIERAREVVDFVTAGQNAGTDAERQIQREGIENARRLLEFQQGQIADPTQHMERALVSALATAFRHTLDALGTDGFRFWPRDGLSGLSAAFRNAVRDGRKRAQDWFATALEWLATAHRKSNARFAERPEPVVRRERFIDPANVEQADAGRLQRDATVPLLYRRLFLPQPVEDPRFLVGRNQEMAALAEARTLWETGQAASVLIVGERGSGKTSLVNCALTQIFDGTDAVRSTFETRLTSAAELHAFLARIVGVPAPDQLKTALLERKRIVIVEDLDRIFLRQIHRFAAIRALLQLISATSRTTLWVITANSATYRLLNAIVPFDPHFSHRINAEATSPEGLREAILMRHSLSGLRLHIEDSRLSPWAWNRIAGLAEDDEMEQRHHDAIFRNSGGVFRSAFKLWQHQVQRVEDGVLYVRVPHRPDREALWRALACEDLFLLAALEQHGSLTAAEAGTVTGFDSDTVSARIDNLAARDLIEMVPAHSEFRVAADAGPAIREMLRHRNLT